MSDEEDYSEGSDEDYVPSGSFCVQNRYYLLDANYYDSICTGPSQCFLPLWFCSHCILNHLHNENDSSLVGT